MSALVKICAKGELPRPGEAREFSAGPRTLCIANFDGVIRALNRIGYGGPLSVEWEDSGMDREWGAQDAVTFVRRVDFAPSSVAFDAAF